MAEQTLITGGAAIRSLRGIAGLTLKEVAIGADTSISYLSKVENGSLIPQKKYVAKVASYISAAMVADDVDELRDATALAAEKVAS